MGHDLPPLPLRDVHTVRWYVLSLPACHKGPAKGLRKELDRSSEETWQGTGNVL